MNYFRILFFLLVATSLCLTKAIQIQDDGKGTVQGNCPISCQKNEDCNPCSRFMNPYSCLNKKCAPLCKKYFNKKQFFF